MVKPRLLRLRPKARQHATGTATTATARIGIRALISRRVGQNPLSALRQSLVRRRPPPAALPAPIQTPEQVSTASLTPQATPIALLEPKPSDKILKSTAPKPPRAEGEDSDDSDGSEDLGGDTVDGGEGRTAEPLSKIKSKKKNANRGAKNWVPKLLNPVEKHRDRVYKKKKRHFLPRPPGPLPLFTESRELHNVLLARIFAFLDPLVPARVCAYVNKPTATAVRAFYDRYCPPPRPVKYLTKRILQDQCSAFPKRILKLLSVRERVRASATCLSFFAACNTLPIEFHNSQEAQAFVKCCGSPLTRRILKRYSQIPSLGFHNMTAEAAVRVLQLLDSEPDEDDEGDEDNDDEGGGEFFAAVTKLVLVGVTGFSSSAGKNPFERLVQALFAEHVSSRLCILELAELHLADLQFKQLARLLRDGHFPALRRLSVARNAFSSRFVRDWSWSFENERFLTLQDLDVSDVGMSNEDLQRFVMCLSRTPALRRLAISRNLCSFATLHALRKQIEAGALTALVEFECEAITADVTALGHLLEPLRAPSACCPLLQQVDVSGNPLCDSRAATQLARIFSFPSVRQLSSGWPELTRLNVSSMQLGDDGFRTISTALCQGPPTRLQHLDISDNGIGTAMDALVRAMKNGKLRYLRSLLVADNELGALEFEALSAALASNCCPFLHTLDLSANFARGEGISRFCSLLLSAPAQSLWVLDLSHNEIPHRSLIQIVEALERGNCLQLHDLNLSRNPELRGVVRLQELIRSGACPSLVVLQVGYIQSHSAGHAFVKDTLRRMSVKELRQRKQQRFEQRLAMVQSENEAKAVRDQARCIRQCQLLREQYDLLENEADRALRRRKKIRKSTHLYINQEIERQKQERAHRLLCRELDGES